MISLETINTDTAQAARAVEGQLGGLGKVAAALKKELSQALGMAQLARTMNQAVAATARLSGQLAALRMNFGQLKAAITRAIEPLAAMVVPVVNRAVMALTGFVRSLGKTMAGFFATAAGGDALAESTEHAATAQKTLGKSLGSVKRALAGFDQLERLRNAGGSSLPDTQGEELTVPGVSLEPFEKALQAIKKFLRDAAARIVGVFAPAIQAWRTAFETAWPPIREALGRMGEALKDLWQSTLAPFGSYLLTQFLPGAVNGISRTLAPVLSQVLPAAAQTAAGALEWLCQGARQAFTGTVAVFGSMCASLQNHWNTYGPALLESFQRFGSGVGAVFSGLYTHILSPVVQKLGQTLTRLWENHLQPLWDKLSGSLLSIGSSLLQLWNAVLQPVALWLIRTLAPAAQTVFLGIADALAAAVGLAADIVGSLVGTLEGLLAFLTGVFTGDWAGAWAGVVRIFQSLFSGITGIARGVINGVITGLNTLVGAVYSAVAAVVNSLGSVVGALGDLFGQSWGFTMPAAPPRIPYLAQGAVLPANKPFLAVVGDQRHGTNIEAPLSTIQEAVRLELEGLLSATVAGMEALLEENRLLRRTVEAIEVGDSVIGEAAARYTRRQNTVKGGLV